MKGFAMQKKYRFNVVDALSITICVLYMAIVLTGCTTTSKITAYDKDGKISSVTEVTSDIVGTIVQATKDKTLVVWESGWVAYLSVSPGTTEDPTPHFKCWAGNVNKGYISILKEHQIDWNGLSYAIGATNKSISVTPAGIVSKTDSGPAK